MNLGVSEAKPLGVTPTYDQIDLSTESLHLFCSYK